MIDPTRPENIVFTPVSPKLALVRIISLLIFMVPLLVASVFLALQIQPWGWIITGALAIVTIWLLWLIPNRVRNTGFAEGADEFLIRRGVMFRRLTVIPYGRIQYVDVAEGPIARFYSIAELKLHTASAETCATLDGVPVEDAVRLRDMLAERGSAEMAGL